MNAIGLRTLLLYGRYGSMYSMDAMGLWALWVYAYYKSMGRTEKSQCFSFCYTTSE